MNPFSKPINFFKKKAHSTKKKMLVYFITILILLRNHKKFSISRRKLRGLYIKFFHQFLFPDQLYFSFSKKNTQNINKNTTTKK